MNKKHFLRLVQIMGFILFVGGIALAIYSGYGLFFTDVKRTEYIIIFSIGIAALVIGILMFFISFKKVKNVCPKCGCSFKGCAYSWQLVRLYNNYSNQMAQYKVIAKCPNCGAEKVFNQDFVVSDYQNRTTTNPQMMIEEWCRNKFGH